jgi:AcrR family transcriptional regulator
MVMPIRMVPLHRPRAAGGGDATVAPVNSGVEDAVVAPRRVRMTRAERRENFLDVAAELVVESGLESVTMERVAARAGVSKALGYAYFDNSDALLAALFDREMARYDGAIRAATTGGASFEDHVRGTVVALFDMVADRGQLFGLLLNGQSSDGSSLGGRRQARREAAEAWIAAGVRQEFGLSEQQALSVASVWIAAGAGVIDAWVRCRGTRSELIELYVALMLGGVQRLAGR